MAAKDGFSGTQIRIVDRRPFQGKSGDMTNVRDLYLIQDNQTLMSGSDASMPTVQRFHRWAVSLGIKVVYDYGTTDPDKRLPSELDGIP